MQDVEFWAMNDAGTFPTVDYATHPAFRGLPTASPEHDLAAETAVRQADLALDEIHAAAPLPVSEVKRRFESRVQPELDVIDRVCGEALNRDPLMAEIVRYAVGDARRDLLREVLDKNQRKRAPARAAGDVSAERIAEELSADGLSLHGVPSKAINAIYEDLAGYRERLTGLAGTNGGGNCALALPPSGRYWEEILSFLTTTKIVAGCSHYRQERLEPIYCALVLSHEGEKWWRGCYEDVGIPTARTVYMHNDKDFGIMKILAYLSEVDERCGPFCFIRGSHRWTRSQTQSFIFKGLDEGSYSRLSSLEPFKTPYYRKAFRYPEFRRQFLLLPRPLRGTSHFGDDLLDDSELAQGLLAKESTITSDVANCMVFVGAEGIHRGGCVQQGRRWALQLALRTVPPVHRRIKRRAKAAYGFARTKVRGAVRRIIGDRYAKSVRALAQRITGG
jgi:hypothetical protein